MIFVYWEWWISIEATKICYFGLALSGIGSQPTRFSDVLNYLKLYEVSSWFFGSIEATKNILFCVMPENTLGQSVCRIFYFWLVNLNTGGPLLHCTCCVILSTVPKVLILFKMLPVHFKKSLCNHSNSSFLVIGKSNKSCRFSTK